MSAALSALCEEGSLTAGSELRPSGGVRGGEVLPAGRRSKAWEVAWPQGFPPQDCVVRATQREARVLAAGSLRE